VREAPKRREALAALVSSSNPGVGDAPAEPMAQAGGIRGVGGHRHPVAWSSLRPAAVEIASRAIGTPEASNIPEAAIRGAQEETQGLYEMVEGSHRRGMSRAFSTPSDLPRDPELLAGVSRRLSKIGRRGISAWQTETAELAGSSGRARRSVSARPRAADVADVAHG